MRTVLVVGAGIFGVASALELRRRGHIVSLLDAGAPPHPDAASTDVSKIVRLDYGAVEPYTALMERALSGWRAWNRELGQTLFHEDGLLVLGRAPLLPGGFERDSMTVLARRGHAVEELDAAAIRARFPAWADSPFDAGYWNPQGGWAESGAVVAALLARALSEGVALHARRGVRELLREGRRVCGALDGDGTAHHADDVIVAAGAWTPLLLPELAGTLLSVGQPVLRFRPAHPERFSGPRFPAFTADIGRTGFYGFPALADGTVKLGNHGTGRPLPADAPREVQPAEEARFRAFLAEALPELADAPIAASRLCLYCDTADRHFLIDRDPDAPGLLVATGGSGHAFKFAPVLGALVADALEGRRHAWSPLFAWRPAPGGGGAAPVATPAGTSAAAAAAATVVPRADAARADGARADAARADAARADAARADAARAEGP
jgi:sarcosine oxidase / L-pipecolate oxidase